MNLAKLEAALDAYSNSPDDGDECAAESEEVRALRILAETVREVLDEAEQRDEIAQSAMHGLAAVRAGDVDHEVNDPRTSAVDTIANVLHWLATTGDDDVVAVLDSAQNHYEAESRAPYIDPSHSMTEGDLPADEVFAAHPKVPLGYCPVCKHYGEDCTGGEADTCANCGRQWSEHDPDFNACPDD